MDIVAQRWTAEPRTRLCHVQGHHSPHGSRLRCVVPPSSLCSNSYFNPENYRSVISATFKYLSLLRSSDLESWRQSEQALIANTRFRFLEKSKPEQYTTHLTSHMDWPLPQEYLISGPRKTEEWDQDGKAEADMRRMLDSLRASKGRVVLMAKPEKYERVRGPQKWETEPIYGTQYLVERFDAALLAEAEAPNDIPELHLPGKNEFIPTNLDVHKQEVAEVRFYAYTSGQNLELIRYPAHQTPFPRSPDSFVVALVQEGRSVLGAESPCNHADCQVKLSKRLYRGIYSYDLTALTQTALLVKLC
jgi:secreted Zn-dependent insulinase-like peptidase